MARRFFTVDFNEENILSSTGSKTTKIDKFEQKSQSENYGIVDLKISNKKANNSKDVRFEKNVTGLSKKNIKANFAQVEDYFDFSFNIQAKSNKIAEESYDVSKDDIKSKICKKKTSNSNKKHISEVAKFCNNFSYDDEVKKIISVARQGALFG